jgi:hypothetical protein
LAQDRFPARKTFTAEEEASVASEKAIKQRGKRSSRKFSKSAAGLASSLLSQEARSVAGNQ